MANKVNFNLKNVHYAVLTEASGGTISYGTPVAIPGAVSLSLSQEGEVSKFYADGIVFYQGSSNNGYSGDVEVARIPEAMLKDIWKMTEGSTSKVLTESTGVEFARFALLFEIDGDADQELNVMYDCTATRPDIEGETTNENKEPKTAKFSISAVPRPDGKIRARTQADTPTATKTGWFSTVFVEGATVAGGGAS